MKTIFLAEAETHVLDALRVLLEEQSEYRLIGVAQTAESLLAQVCKSAPEILLLDWNLPAVHHQRLLRALRDCCPDTSLVVMSVKPEDAIAAREHGIDQFVAKQLPAEAFLDALQANLSAETSRGKTVDQKSL